MFKLTIRNLLRKKIRFALTTGIVVIGVMFVVAVFALTDSIRTSFDGLAADIEAGIDLTVRVPLEFGDELDREMVPPDTAALIRDVPGVARVDGRVAARNTFIIDDQGNPLIPGGPPGIGFSWFPTQFFIIEGHEPDGPSEFAVNTKTAAEGSLTIGTTYRIAGPVEQREFELVGIYNFGTPGEDSSLGATLVAFDLPTAQDFLGRGDGFNEISIALEPGADATTVSQAIEDAVGAEFEVIDREAKVEETEGDFNQFISVFGNALLAFALISVFVAAFIINNTFQIVLGQRIRELGLLRAIGATGRQVSQSVLGEAALVGTVATAVGTVVGYWLAWLLRKLLNAGGFSLPEGPLELRPRTIIFAVIVGIVVTMVSSILPAYRARKISPMAALSDSARLSKGSLAQRIRIGGLMIAVGSVLMLLGLFGGFDTKPLLIFVSLGAVLVFIGTAVTSPAFASRWAGVIGWPVQRFFGVPGRLARGNAARAPRRTSSTASALMIGLTLVSMAAVVAESIKQTFIETLDNSVQADFVVVPESGNFGPGVGFPLEVADELTADPNIDLVVGYRFGFNSININGNVKNVFTTDFSAGTRHLDPDLITGSFDKADPLGSIMLHKDPARDLNAEIGDTVVVGFPDGEFEPLKVAAIYANGAVYDNYLIDNALWAEHFNRPSYAFATLSMAGYTNSLSDDEKAALVNSTTVSLEQITEAFPTIKIESRVDFRESQQDQLDLMLIVISIFLGLALFIALIGVANTLALSVFERTREIGLLRAVGLTRRQLRRAVRWEAAIIAVFGALLGMVLGVVFGVATSIAIPDTLVKSVAIPWIRLTIYVAVTAVAGLMAAIYPARRAARMNILEAIASE